MSDAKPGEVVDWTPSAPSGTTYTVTFLGQQPECAHHFPGWPHAPCWEIPVATSLEPPIDKPCQCKGGQHPCKRAAVSGDLCVPCVGCYQPALEPPK